jgi:predicted RNase H-like HicB family nuclease
MKTIIAVIEKASDGGYGIFCPELKGVALFGYGQTEPEAKEGLMTNLENILEHYQEENLPIPDGIAGNVRFEYKYIDSSHYRIRAIQIIALSLEEMQRLSV